jgi:lipopolysaccharide biosynthesis glycosyltransferase
MSKYNIAFSINRNLLLFTMVTIYSLLKHNKSDFFDVYILHDKNLTNE